MCLSNVKHQRQPRLATSPSNGYPVPVLPAAAEAAIYGRQRRPIGLSQFKVDNSANLLSFKQTSRISPSAFWRKQQSSFRSSLRSLFRSSLPSIFIQFQNLGSSLARPSFIHCFYSYKNSDIIPIFSFNRPSTRSIERPSIRKAPVAPLHSNSRTLEKRHPINNCKFRKANRKTTNSKPGHRSGLASESTARLVRRPNLVQQPVQNQNCLSNPNNRKRPTISAHLRSPPPPPQPLKPIAGHRR